MILFEHEIAKRRHGWLWVVLSEFIFPRLVVRPGFSQLFPKQFPHDIVILEIRGVLVVFVGRLGGSFYGDQNKRRHPLLFLLLVREP